MGRGVFDGDVRIVTHGAGLIAGGWPGRLGDAVAAGRRQKTRDTSARICHAPAMGRQVGGRPGCSSPLPLADRCHFFSNVPVLLTWTPPCVHPLVPNSPPSHRPRHRAGRGAAGYRPRAPPVWPAPCLPPWRSRCRPPPRSCERRPCQRWAPSWICPELSCWMAAHLIPQPARANRCWCTGGRAPARSARCKAPA